MRRKARFPLMALGLLALLTALWGGLVRLGWVLPPVPLPLSVVHGLLGISLFLIALVLVLLRGRVVLHR